MTEEEKNGYWKNLFEQSKDVQENQCKMDSRIFKEIEQMEYL